MADLSNELNKIRTALYGKDVRSSLATGIEKINEEVIVNTQIVNEKANEISNSITEFSNNESERKANETNRILEFNNLKKNLNETVSNGNDTVNNLNSMKENLKDELNSLKTNVSIGGDNFITNGMLRDSIPKTLNIRDWNYWGDTSTISIFSNPDYNATGCVYFAGTGTGGVYQDIDIRNFNDGEQYVASFDYFKQGSVKSIQAYIETYDGNGVKLPDGCLLSNGATTGDNTYCICPFTVPSNKEIASIRLSFSFNGANEYNGSVIQLGNIKISSGIVPTKGNSFSKGDLDSMINPLNEKLKYNGMTFISGENTTIEAHRNQIYAVNGTNQVEIISINHTAMDNGDKCYFLVASGDENSKITFRSENLKASNVFLTGGKDQVFNGKDNGDLIITLYKSGDSARLTYDSQFGGLKENVSSNKNELEKFTYSKINNFSIEKSKTGVIRISGWKNVTSSKEGTWVTINLPITLPNNNYIVNLTCVDGRVDNSFRRIKLGNNQNPKSFDVFIDWCTGFDFEVVCPPN